MKKIIIMMLLSFSVFSAEVEWSGSYEVALAKAKKANKPLLVLITSETCSWCRKLESTTLKDEKIAGRINDKFEAVNVTRDKSIYPKTLAAKMVPMSYFVDPKTGKHFFSFPGYWNVENYDSVLDDALDKYKK
jgi:uncharacterized protein YyaL (SSP411 family)